jgi:hypothetical protein
VKKAVGLLAGLLVVGTATAGAAPRASCPGPGCMPVGTFSIPVPPSGKVTFYRVTVTGTAAKPTVVALSITGATPKGTFTAAAVESKPVVTSGKERATIYISVSTKPHKRAFAAVAASLTFEGFAPSGQLSGATANATPVSCSVFKSKYPKAPVWKNFWADSSYHGGTDALQLIVEALGRC